MSALFENRHRLIPDWTVHSRPSRHIPHSSTWPGPGSGSAASRTSKAAGPPAFVIQTARIAVPPQEAKHRPGHAAPFTTRTRFEDTRDHGILPGVEGIRLASPLDAEPLLALQHRLDAQSSSMLLEPGEREQDPEPLRTRLAAQNRTSGSFDLVADGPDGLAGWLAGWLEVQVLPYRRAQHTGYLVIGVDAAAAGRGIGTALLAEAAAEAIKRGLLRLELTVMTDNLRAVGLYLRSGFQVEGVRRQALHRDGTAVDEYYMGRLLS
jgi:ribosomal protein S18 acetylase RimI-like enzyme